MQWANLVDIPQVRLLRDLLLILEKQDPGKFLNVEVATVDGFQGREKEVSVKTYMWPFMIAFSFFVLPLVLS